LLEAILAYIEDCWLSSGAMVTESVPYVG